MLEETLGAIKEAILVPLEPAMTFNQNDWLMVQTSMTDLACRKALSVAVRAVKEFGRGGGQLVAGGVI